LDNLFPATHDPFLALNLDIALTASIKSDTTTPADTVVSTSTLHHGLVLHAKLYARDFLLALFHLAARVHRRRLGLEPDS